MTVSRLAKDASIHRTQAYRALERLEGLALARCVGTHPRRYVGPDPASVAGLVEAAARALCDVLAPLGVQTPITYEATNTRQNQAAAQSDLERLMASATASIDILDLTQEPLSWEEMVPSDIARVRIIWTKGPLEAIDTRRIEAAAQARFAIVDGTSLWVASPAGWIHGRHGSLGPSPVLTVLSDVFEAMWCGASPGPAPNH